MAIYDVNGNELSKEYPSSYFWHNNLGYPYWILHLDCARKYFSVANIKTVIDQISNAGFNQLQLHFSENEGFRLKLDDMIVEDDDGNTYNLASCIGGNESPSSFYTQSDMDNIIDYAQSKGIDIVPSFDMPAHMGWILSVFTGFRSQINNNYLDITNNTAVKFAKAIVKKYADYFSNKGCHVYNLGYDESGFSTYYTNDMFDFVISFANNMCDVIKGFGMIPRIYNDGVHYDNNFSYAWNRDFEILYWQKGSIAAQTLQNMGYKMINSSRSMYWVNNSATQVTSEALSQMDLLKGFHTTSTNRNGNGACLSIWCDYSASASDNGDGGDAVITAIAPLISAFGANAMSVTSV